MEDVMNWVRNWRVRMGDLVGRFSWEYANENDCTHVVLIHYVWLSTTGEPLDHGHILLQTLSKNVNKRPLSIALE